LGRGGPLTVTDPEMTRYFMTTREAVELVLQAAALAWRQPQPGAVFMLDMGEPVRIVDLARQMIRLAGKQPEIDGKIDFTGRPPAGGEAARAPASRGGASPPRRRARAAAHRTRRAGMAGPAAGPRCARCRFG